MNHLTLPESLPRRFYNSKSPQELSGCLIDANNDIDAIKSFLFKKASGSKNTLSAYIKEIERFLMWCDVKHKVLSEINADSFDKYLFFLFDPSPASNWIGERVKRNSANWKPFTSPLSVSSVKTSKNILSSLFSYLSDTGYINANPARVSMDVMKIASILQNKGQNVVINSKEYKSHSAEKIETYFNETTVDIILNYLDALDSEKKRNAQKKTRSIFVFKFFLYTGARIFEAQSSNMNSLILSPDGFWRWHVFGKGNFVDKIAIPDILLEAFKQYRLDNKLFPLADEGDNSSLIRNLSFTKRLGVRQLRNVLYEIFRDCADSIEKTNARESRLLRIASAHWMRHTNSTIITNKVGIDFAKDSLRHSNVDTTLKYSHSSDKDKHTKINKVFS